MYRHILVMYRDTFGCAGLVQCSLCSVCTGTFCFYTGTFCFCTGAFWVLYRHIFCCCTITFYRFWSDQQNFLYTSFSLNLRISILLMPYCTALSYSISIKIRRIQIRLFKYFCFVLCTSNVLNT